MKKIRIIGLLIIGSMLSACGRSNIQHGERVPFPDDWLEVGDALDIKRWEIDEAISPDGRWLVDMSNEWYKDNTFREQIHFISLANPNLELLNQQNDNPGENLGPRSWSPDSSAKCCSCLAIRPRGNSESDI